MEMTINNSNKGPTLCLNMIVKNESKIITRLLNSVLPIIDCYCICDTGSTDNTIQLIVDFFVDKNIPGKIIFEPFKNFSHNRTMSLKSCVGMSDYVLLLDADMILEIRYFNKQLLNDYDCFKILQGSESFYYENLRIIRNNGLYSYVGVTHEYIDTPNDCKIISIPKNVLFINDIGDGGSKSDKFERDIKLLTDGIANEPFNVRYHFYLANSYYDSNNYNQAIEYYKKRIGFGGWKEEVWYSYYRLGLCCKKLNRIADAISYWLDGFDFYPDRLEGIYELIEHYRNISKHKLCNIFYKLAKEVLDKNLDRDTYLFLHNEIYTYKIHYEYTIFSSYIGNTNINNEVVCILNNSRDTLLNDNLLNNMKFYKDILPQKQQIVLDNKIKKELNNEELTLTSSSSCIINNPDKNKNTYFMNVRYVNYIISETGRYLNTEKHVITYNKFIEFDKNFDILNEKVFDTIYEDRPYMGIEDIKMFYDKYNDEIIFNATGYHKNKNLGIVTGKYKIQHDVLDYKEIKSSFNNCICEKNWVFVDYNNSTHIIYNWFPLHICKVDDENNLLLSCEKKPMPLLFNNIRGSTSGYKYITKINMNDDNISLNVEEIETWFVVHLVSYEEPRHYYHMIVILDDKLNLLRYSAPFKFEGTPIEYCLGLIVEDERVIMTYSTWDRTTRIGIYDKKYIDSIVKYK